MLGGMGCTPDFDLSSFLPPFNTAIDLFVDTNGGATQRKKAIVLHGVPHCCSKHILFALLGLANSGKSELAEAQGPRPLVISPGCFEDLYHIVFDGPRATSHLVFDEFDSGLLTAEQCISLLTTWKARSMRVRNRCTITVCHVLSLSLAGTSVSHPYRSSSPQIKPARGPMTIYSRLGPTLTSKKALAVVFASSKSQRGCTSFVIE